MEALAYWKTITVDHANLLERLIAKLDDSGIAYCVVGGQAVNAYVEPLVSLDLVLAVAAADVERIAPLLERELRVERFPHSINVSLPGSDLRVQFQTDPRYFDFPERSERRTVLGLDLPVATLRDVLDGKVWAALDSSRRPSKRQKDLADVSRILEHFPELRSRVSDEILERLLS
jgi:hypothetical protein